MTPELARIIAAMVDAKLDALGTSIDSSGPTRGIVARRSGARTHHRARAGSVTGSRRRR